MVVLVILLKVLVLVIVTKISLGVTTCHRQLLCVKVRRLSFVRYFAEETTEAISRQLFADSHKLIFIIDGRSSLLVINRVA